jgi:uncharacterized protein (DUF169 family)
MTFNVQKALDLGRRLGFADAPVAMFYTDQTPPADAIHPKSGVVLREEHLKDGLDMDSLEHIYPCVLAYVRRARRSGVTAYFDAQHFGCGGGGFYLGCAGLSPIVPEFVTTGRPGAFEGEHLVKDPETFRRLIREMNILPAPAKYCVFKRIDKLAPDETPQAAIFFGAPDEMAGLTNLANYAAEDWHAVLAPFGAACATIVQFPYQESLKRNPRAVLGSFDIAARPFVEPDYLSLAIPTQLLERMMAVIDSAFLNTRSWQRVIKRIRRRRGETVSD